MILKKINIITVGYNESHNLKKLYGSLERLYFSPSFEIRKIYIDQSSQDDSVSVAHSFGVEVFEHENKGYADPDKKWAVNKLVGEGEYCFLLDADETVSQDLIDEILIKKHPIIIIPIYIYFMGSVIQKAKQIRFFLKDAVKMTDTIHEYISPQTKDVYITKAYIENRDDKFLGKEIFSVVEKTNRYTSREVRNDSKIVMVFKMFIMPIIWFFGWGVKNGNFFCGIPGIINSILMSYYQFILYAKQYEKCVYSNNIKENEINHKNL